MRAVMSGDVTPGQVGVPDGAPDEGRDGRRARRTRPDRARAREPRDAARTGARHVRHGRRSGRHDQRVHDRGDRRRRRRRPGGEAREPSRVEPGAARPISWRRSASGSTWTRPASSGAWPRLASASCSRRSSIRRSATRGRSDGSCVCPRPSTSSAPSPTRPARRAGRRRVGRADAAADGRGVRPARHSREARPRRGRPRRARRPGPRSSSTCGTVRCTSRGWIPRRSDWPGRPPTTCVAATPPRRRAARDVLGGEAGPKRDVVVLNAGAALEVAGFAGDLEDGLRLAAASIDEGKAAATLDRGSRSRTRSRRDGAFGAPGWPDWLGLVVDDLDGAHRFYAGLLGREPAATGDDWVQFDMGEGRSRLLRRDDGAGPVRADTVPARVPRGRPLGGA